MTLTIQDLEAYVPVYDSIPENWEEAKPFLVEQLKKISNAVNIREIGYFLDVELLSGKAFTPPANPTGSSSQYRSVLRMVVDVSPLAAGANSFPHGITFDSNFTLISLWVAATDSVGFRAQEITSNDVYLDATNINITSPQAFDRAFCIIEYTLEV
jgi:hypothetical protein